jgi:hypothetical protein
LGFGTWGLSISYEDFVFGIEDGLSLLKSFVHLPFLRFSSVLSRVAAFLGMKEV